jgi:PBP1b-binding outer membrane lipoprotein LpoB
MTTKIILVVLCGLVLFTGCYSMTHKVGNGGAGTETATRKQWFAFWGLLPMGKIDSQKMAKGATNYTVNTKWGFVDIVINIFTSWVTIYTRTITVTK